MLSAYDAFFLSGHRYRMRVTTRVLISKPSNGSLLAHFPSDCSQHGRPFVFLPPQAPIQRRMKILDGATRHNVFFFRNFPSYFPGSQKPLTFLFSPLAGIVYPVYVFRCHRVRQPPPRRPQRVMLFGCVSPPPPPSGLLPSTPTP